MSDPITQPSSNSSPETEAQQHPGEKITEEGKDKGNTAPPKSFGREFILAFGTIFLAELGDKTQLSTLLMTAESKSPWIVFAGAAGALITTSLLGVVIGRWLARYLSPEALKTMTGASLLFIAVLLIWDTVHL